MKISNKLKKHPFITVVVPAFNEEKYLRRCLEALKKQNYNNNFETIVVDNNSSDNTIKIAKEFGARIILEPRQGYVFALKRGMDEAKGEIIAVTDADCEVAPNWLEKIAKAFKDKKIIGLTGNCRLSSPSKSFEDVSHIMFHFFLVGTFRMRKPNMNGLNCAIRRDVYKRIGGIDTRFTMSPDVDLGMRLKKYGKVIYLKDLIVSTSARRFENRIFQALLEYGKGYVYSVWLRKPPPVEQSVIR